MARDGKNHIDIKPQPCFVKDRFTAKDYGNAGIKFELYYRGTVDAEFLEVEDVNRFIKWLCQTTGQYANVLPLEIIGVLQSVIVKDKKKKILTTYEKRILKYSLKVLKAVTVDRTPSGKLKSLAARARARK